MTFKIPKQWKHWCTTNNLRIHGKKFGKRKSQWLYMKGQGFVWRVNDKGMLQRGDTHDQFDRWALCRINEAPLPKTAAEFAAAVRSLKSQFKPE